MRDRLQTTSLHLRLPVADDAAELHAIFSDPATNTIGGGPFTSEDQTARWITNRRAAFREHGLVWYLVLLRQDGTLLGNCGLLIGRTTAMQPEIGYMIRATHQRCGYATEAAEAVLAEAADAGFRTIWSTIRPGNAASCRVIERSGFKVDRTEEDAAGALRYYVRHLDGGRSGR